MLRQRREPLPPSDRRDEFDPLQKRIVTWRHGELRPHARYVLDWMQIHRRAQQNQALNFAIALANKLNLPVVVYEGLRPDYDQANDRIHQFIIEGGLANQKDFAKRGIRYCFYLLPEAQKGNRRAVAQLAQEAAMLVTDDPLAPSLRFGWLQPQHLHGHSVVFRQARSRVGAAAPGLRPRALHDFG